MTGLLDLAPIFHSADSLTTLHEIQLRRLAERAVTGGDRPPGMRLSIDDPVRRVKAAFDERWRISIDAGIAERGYLAEDLLEVALFHTEGAPHDGRAYKTQVPIVWGEVHRSAFDFLTPYLTISCKSSTTAPVHQLRPSRANMEQERRMLVAHGRIAGERWHTWMVHPGALKARGPFEHELTRDDVVRIRAELDATLQVYAHFQQADDPTQLPEWNDPEWWRARGLESTSGAFILERLDASAAVEARNRAFLRAREALRAAKAEEEAARQLIRTHVEEQLRLNPDASSVLAYSGDAVAVYSVDKRGALRCVEKPVDAGVGV